MEMVDVIRERLERAIQEHVFPGCVFGMVDREGKKTFISVGNYTYEKDSPSVTENTMYDMASVTKAIPGSCALLKLLDEGKLNLEDRLIEYVPEFGNYEDKKDVRIQHLLTYTLDLDVPSMASLKDKRPEDIYELVCKAPLKSAPGEKHMYTNSTAFFFGLIVEKITGKTIDVYAEENFFAPLHMTRTTFFPETFPKEDIAPTEIDAWRGRVLQGEVHDESTYTLRQKYMTVISGLFSTAPDIITFLEMLLHKGEKDGRRYFSEKIVSAMYTNQLQGNEVHAGLGWELEWALHNGFTKEEQIFSKTGFTGTFVAMHPKKTLAFALLSNRIYPTRPDDASKIIEVRKDIAHILFR